MNAGFGGFGSRIIINIIFRRNIVISSLEVGFRGCEENKEWSEG